MNRILAPALLMVAFGGSAAAQTTAQPPAYPVAVLQTLDKVTGRVRTVEAPVEQTVRFGTLEIQPRFCDRAPPEEPPESTAFLDIYEARAGEQRADLFHGWMFASSPALNSLEHPVYDVWVLECKQAQQGVAPPPASPDQQR